MYSNDPPPAHSAEALAVPRTVIERPPPGLARGEVPVSAWVVSTLGATVVLSSALYLARRWRSGRRR